MSTDAWMPTETWVPTETWAPADANPPVVKGDDPTASALRNLGRNPIQRQPAPLRVGPEVSGETRGDHPMTAKEFSKWKHTLLPTLRQRGDPPPRTMEHGRGPVGDGQFAANINSLLKRNAHRGSVLVRGFRLHHISLVPNDERVDWGVQNAWRASFHLVVAHPPPDGSTKWIYECANLPADEEHIGVPYIFVPSSRGHAELSDEAVLSNKWILGYVVGGHAHFCEMVILDQKLRGRRRSVLGTTPEAAVSKRATKCYLLPGFEQWHRARDIDDTMDVVAESFGFPVVDIDSCLDIDNLKDVKAAIANNTDALVDGLETLTMHMTMATQHSQKKITDEEMAMRFFDHYDKRRVRIEKRQSEIMDKELARMGYLAKGSGQGAL
jgi:hypothetical protein